jgi:hypothetical protein
MTILGSILVNQVNLVTLEGFAIVVSLWSPNFGSTRGLISGQSSAYSMALRSRSIHMKMGTGTLARVQLLEHFQ